VLVLAPGAGGSTAKAMRALGAPLRERGCDVVFCDDHGIEAGQTRWNTMNPSAPGNLSHVLAVVARAAAAHPGQRVFLCGASFGCRVLAELLRTRQTELPDSVHKDALVCAGYPLHKVGKPEGADPKRANHLLQLPKKCAGAAHRSDARALAQATHAADGGRRLTCARHCARCAQCAHALPLW
jgi:predicted alpha/beta-hydrolase family hydrolase